MKRVVLSVGCLFILLLVVGFHFALQRYEFHPVGSYGRHVVVCDRLTGKVERREPAEVAVTLEPSGQPNVPLTPDASRDDRWKVVSDRPAGKQNGGAK